MDYQALAQTTILFDIATGILLVALGVFVLTIRPRRGLTLALGVFCVAAGGGNALANAAKYSLVAGSVSDLLALVLYPTGVVALAWLAVRWPEPVGPRERGLVIISALVGAATFAGGGEFTLLAGGADLTARVARELAFDAFRGAQFFLLSLLALRYPGFVTAANTRAARGAAVVSVALLLWFAGRAGLSMGRLAAGDATPIPVNTGSAPILLEFATTFVLLILWLVAAALGSPTGARTARNVALAIPATTFVMLVFTISTDPSHAGDLGLLGFLRGVGVAVLAHAILKNQIPGIDLKLRWTLSKSTIAAAFIAVFFVTSEVAQQYFGETLESTYLGIAAAGALVFAMAPLQRAAERLAEKAVPVVTPTADTSASSAPSGRDAAYRRAVRLALCDRRLSRDEQLHLFELAHHLGIPPLEADRIHAEVEREVRG